MSKCPTQAIHRVKPYKARSSRTRASRAASWWEGQGRDGDHPRLRRRNHGLHGTCWQAGIIDPAKVERGRWRMRRRWPRSCWRPRP